MLRGPKVAAALHPRGLPAALLLREPYRAGTRGGCPRAGSRQSRGQASAQQRSGDATGSEVGNAEEGEDGRPGELFLETLKEMYNAEKQMLRAMGRIGRQSQSYQLRQALHMPHDGCSTCAMAKVFSAVLSIA